MPLFFLLLSNPHSSKLISDNDITNPTFSHSIRFIRSLARSEFPFCTSAFVRAILHCVAFPELIISRAGLKLVFRSIFQYLRNRWQRDSNVGRIVTTRRDNAPNELENVTGDTYNSAPIPSRIETLIRQQHNEA